MYGGKIEDLDLIPGVMAEDFPEGFAFSDTAFRIFILMASRRLNSDRFFTDYFTDEVYTPEGMPWITRHHDELGARAALPGAEADGGGLPNAFAFWNPDGAEVTAPPALDDRRVAIVNEHMRLENAYDFPGCVGVFGQAAVPADRRRGAVRRRRPGALLPGAESHGLPRLRLRAHPGVADDRRGAGRGTLHRHAPRAVARPAAPPGGRSTSRCA